MKHACWSNLSLQRVQAAQLPYNEKPPQKHGASGAEEVLQVLQNPHGSSGDTVVRAADIVDDIRG